MLLTPASDQVPKHTCYQSAVKSVSTFTFMHLADAFIQNALQCIQAINLFLSVCLVMIRRRERLVSAQDGY